MELFQATRYKLQRPPLVDMKQEPVSGGLLLLKDILGKPPQKIRKKYRLVHDTVREECDSIGLPGLQVKGRSSETI